MTEIILVTDTPASSKAYAEGKHFVVEPKLEFERIVMAGMAEKNKKQEDISDGMDEDIEFVVESLSDVLSPDEMEIAEEEIKGINYELNRMGETVGRIAKSYEPVH